jgi:hypothetical protein
MTAPIASGWSGCRVGFAPTGKRRLVTAHTRNGPAILFVKAAIEEKARPWLTVQEIPLVATNEEDLNENNRAGGGDRRKDVFAEALMPEIVQMQHRKRYPQGRQRKPDHPIST